jgi:hypothetical protein
MQVRSTTSYYQIAVNLPATYYGNVTVALTVRIPADPSTVVVTGEDRRLHLHAAPHSG